MGVYSKSSTMNESALDMSNITGEGHIMDAVIESVTNDLNMFNAVITLDFAEAYTNLGMDVFMEVEALPAPQLPATTSGTALATVDKKEGQSSKSNESTKAAKDGIAKKLIEFLKKVKEKLSAMIKTLMDKLTEVLTNGSKLLAKYESDFDKNAKTKKVDSHVLTTAMEAVAQSKNITEKLKADTKTAQNKIDAASSAEDAAKVASEYNEAIKKFDMGEAFNVYGDNAKKEEHILSADEITEIKNTLRDKGRIKSIKASASTSIACIDASRASIKIDKRKSDDSIVIAKCNAEYRVLTTEANTISKITSQLCKGATRHFSVCRKLFLTVARGSSEEAKETTEESAMMDYIIGEASDIYMEKLFA